MSAGTSPLLREHVSDTAIHTFPVPYSSTSTPTSPIPPETTGGTHSRLPLDLPRRWDVWGSHPRQTVVVYDDVGGRYAARMWWMLRAIGHQNVLVLDGGLEGWVDGGNPVESGERTNPPARYPVPCQFTGVVTHDGLSGRTVIDARSAERYRGDQEPLDPVAGHIPGAVNIPTDENLDENGRFKDQSDLRVLYAEVEDSPVVSCGSGVTACHDALAMVVAGREMPDIYVGSYSEWSRLGLPVTTGEDP